MNQIPDQPPSSDQNPNASTENASPEPKKGWLNGENRIWAIPIGILTVGLICSGCVTIFYIGAINTIKNGPAYKMGAEVLKSNKEAAAILGEPFETGIPTEKSTWDYTTTKGENGRDQYNGNAMFVIPVTGSKNDGMLTLYANVRKDKWTLKKVTLDVHPKGAFQPGKDAPEPEQTLVLLDVEDNPIPPKPSE